jgi:hypothetical protein
LQIRRPKIASARSSSWSSKSVISNVLPQAPQRHCTWRQERCWDNGWPHRGHVNKGGSNRIKPLLGITLATSSEPKLIGLYLLKIPSLGNRKGKLTFQRFWVMKGLCMGIFIFNQRSLA